MAIISVPQGPDFWGQMGQTFMQHLILSQQNQAEKERLKIEKDKFNLLERQANAEMERAAAGDRAASAALMNFLGASAQNPILNVQQNPLAPQGMPQGVPQGQQAPQGFSQLPPSALPFAQGAQGPVTPPNFTPVPGAMQGNKLPAGVTRDMLNDPGFAAAFLDQLRTQEEHTSLVGQRNAATEANLEQTKLFQIERKQKEELFPLLMDRERANLALTQAQTDETRANAERLRRQANQQIQQSAREMALARMQGFSQYVQMLVNTGIVPEKEARGTASRLFFGSTKVPSVAAITAEESQILDRLGSSLSSVEGGQEMFGSMLEQRRRTQIAENLGLGPEQQTNLDVLLSQNNNDPQAVIDQMGASGSATPEGLALVAGYLSMVAPGTELRMPEKEPGFWQRAREFFKGKREDGGARRPAAGGGSNGAASGASPAMSEEDRNAALIELGQKLQRGEITQQQWFAERSRLLGNPISQGIQSGLQGINAGANSAIQGLSGLLPANPNIVRQQQDFR